MLETKCLLDCRTASYHTIPALDLVWLEPIFTTFIIYVQGEDKHTAKTITASQIWSNFGIMQGQESTQGIWQNEHSPVCWALWAEGAASFWSELIIGSVEQVSGETTPAGH